MFKLILTTIQCCFWFYVFFGKAYIAHAVVASSVFAMTTQFEKIYKGE